jgi:hypothetical protein
MELTFNDLAESTCQNIARQIAEARYRTTVMHPKRAEAAYVYVLDALYSNDPVVCDVDLNELAEEGELEDGR